MTREGEVAAAASWGSSTSSPQHLYHKSPQRVYGSLQWAGVGSIRKSHRLSGSMCLSYFTVDSLPFSRPHSQQPLRIISSNLSLPCWEAIFKQIFISFSQFFFPPSPPPPPSCPTGIASLLVTSGEICTKRKKCLWQGRYFCQHESMSLLCLRFPLPFCSSFKGNVSCLWGFFSSFVANHRYQKYCRQSLWTWPHRAEVASRQQSEKHTWFHESSSDLQWLFALTIKSCSD